MCRRTRRRSSRNGAPVVYVFAGGSQPGTAVLRHHPLVGDRGPVRLHRRGARLAAVGPSLHAAGDAVELQQREPRCQGRRFRVHQAADPGGRRRTTAPIRAEVCLRPLQRLDVRPRHGLPDARVLHRHRRQRSNLCPRRRLCHLGDSHVPEHGRKRQRQPVPLEPRRAPQSRDVLAQPERQPRRCRHPESVQTGVGPLQRTTLWRWNNDEGIPLYMYGITAARNHNVSVDTAWTAWEEWFAKWRKDRAGNSLSTKARPSRRSQVHRFRCAWSPVLNLRRTAGLVDVVLTAEVGDLASWDVSERPAAGRNACVDQVVGAGEHPGGDLQEERSVELAPRQGGNPVRHRTGRACWLGQPVHCHDDRAGSQVGTLARRVLRVRGRVKEGQVTSSAPGSALEAEDHVARADLFSRGSVMARRTPATCSSIPGAAVQVATTRTTSTRPFLSRAADVRF